MQVTRNVILDLLPLYLADEVSTDTRTLVEKYLEADPELASIAEQSVAMESLEDIPVPLTQEDRMEAYRKAKRLMLLRIIILAVVISCVLSTLLMMVALAVFFFLPS
jgi:uncharacterized membrane protein